VTAWAAWRQGLPVLGISHQAAFSYPVPRTGDDWVSRLVMRRYAPVSSAVGLHWFHFGFPILPPIIDPLTPQADDGSILVYLPFESLSAIQGLLARYAAVNFVCFHPAIRESQLCGICCSIRRAARRSSRRWLAATGSYPTVVLNWPPRR